MILRKNSEVWKEFEYLETHGLAFEKRKMRGHATEEISAQEFLTYEAQLLDEGTGQRQKPSLRKRSTLNSHTN